MSQSGSAVFPAAGGSWRKSTRCESQACVEVAPVAGGMAIRNSTAPDRQLAFPAATWRNFISAIREGEFDIA